jgi:ADP-ribose pyrophosphatase YjhB (NUDIX family)
VLEETGLVVEVAEILGVFGGRDFRYVYANGDAVEYTVVLFRCVATGETNTGLASETKSLRYFSIAEMPRLALPYPTEAVFSGY